MLNINSSNDLEEIIKHNNIMLIKFDNNNSKYDEYFNTLNDFKLVNITTTEIIEFYDIEVLPTICIYKNKNLIFSIEGYYSKSILLKKINEILN